jgi:hypothetical protein
MSKVFNEIENSGKGVRVVEKLLADQKGKSLNQVAL